MTKTFINFFFLIDYKMRSTFAAFPHTYSAKTFEYQQRPVYEAKVPTSDGYSKI